MTGFDSQMQLLGSQAKAAAASLASSPVKPVSYTHLTLPTMS